MYRFLCILLIACLLFSCSEQKKLPKELQNKIQIKRIIEGASGELAAIFGYGSDSVYIIGKDTVTVCYISEYDNVGNIIKFLMYKSEGPLEYSVEELIADTALFEYTGGKNVKDWKLVDFPVFRSGLPDAGTSKVNFWTLWDGEKGCGK